MDEIEWLDKIEAIKLKSDLMSKKPTIIEISVKAMDDDGIEKEFHFLSMGEFKNWWRNPYEY